VHKQCAQAMLRALAVIIVIMERAIDYELGKLVRSALVTHARSGCFIGPCAGYSEGRAGEGGGCPGGWRLQRGSGPISQFPAKKKKKAASQQELASQVAPSQP
jgi:hypothetical protein